MAELLRILANVRTLTAHDGVEALALVIDRRPDVVILDLDMPRMDGIETAQEIRNMDLQKCLARCGYRWD